jgi:hypothetical protein
MAMAAAERDEGERVVGPFARGLCGGPKDLESGDVLLADRIQSSER